MNTNLEIKQAEYKSWTDDKIYKGQFLTRRDTIDKDIIREIWDERYYFKYARQVRKQDVVVDIGAHIGIFSILAAKLGAKKVLAFEPQQDNFNLLEANISINDCQKVIEAIPQAVVAEQGQYRLRENKHDNTGRNVLNKKKGSIVKTVQISDALNGLDKIDFLKVDVEGMEYELFKSHDIWEHKIEHLVMEWHQGIKKAYQLAGHIMDNSDLILIELFGKGKWGRLELILENET
jgi:FkbM family methyltransferase